MIMKNQKGQEDTIWKRSKSKTSNSTIEWEIVELTYIERFQGTQWFLALQLTL